MSSVTADSTDATSTGFVFADETTSAPPKRNVGRIVEQTWIWSVVGYSVVKFFIAWGAFAGHGVNPWIFGIIDLATAWPYAKAITVVCKRVASSEWKRLPSPLVIALATFFAPYAYVWFAAGELPGGIRVGMVIFVLVLFLAATAGVVTQSRKLRREAVVVDVRAPAQAIIKLAATDGNDGVIIDLTDNAEAGELVIDLTDGAAKFDRHRVRR